MCDRKHGCPFMDPDEIRESAFKDGFQAGFNVGATAVSEAAAAHLMARSEVVNLYRNGPHTVIETADGEKTRVTYHPEYGYPYDNEKALMAAMLKALVGNRYIVVLRKFAYDTADDVDNVECKGAKQNVARGMIRKIRHALRDAWANEPDPFDPDEYADQIGGEYKPAKDECDAGVSWYRDDAVEENDDDVMMDGDFKLCDDGGSDGSDAARDMEDAELLSDVSSMDSEPGFDPSLFA